jgi:hypothetical protein
MQTWPVSYLAPVTQHRASLADGCTRWRSLGILKAESARRKQEAAIVNSNKEQENKLIINNSKRKILLTCDRNKMEWVGRLRANTATNQTNPCRTAHLLLPSSSTANSRSHNGKKNDASRDDRRRDDKGKDKNAELEADGEEEGEGGGGSRLQLEIDLEIEGDHNGDDGKVVDAGDIDGRKGKVRLSGAEVEGRYAHRMIVLSLPLPFCTSSLELLLFTII